MKYFFVFLLTASLFACNFSPKPIDIEIDEPPQKLVISSYLVPLDSLNDFTTLTLTRTFTALVNDDSLDLNDSTNTNLSNLVFVENGLVRIGHKGIEYDLGELAPSIYSTAELDYKFRESYSLYAKDFVTGEEITAETMLLAPVDYDSIWVAPLILPNFGDTLYDGHIKFKDIPNEENFYLLTYTDLATFTNSAGIGTNIFSQASSTFSVFADAEYGDGTAIDYTISGIGSKGDTLIVGFSNITKGYYEYLSAYRRSGNVLSQLSGEPINLPTNVQNGYGYFALIWPKLEVVVLD